jgi:hypothetical protein
MKWIPCTLGCALFAVPIAAQTYPGPYPQTELSNGVLHATIYLPDAEKGFYRGTRFDWAGIVASLEYKGHNYFGPFFEKFDPSVPDVVIGDPVAAGINSAASGPVEEFIGADGAAVGFTEAKPGEAFCKIGVGSLRRSDKAAYSSYENYAILNGGRRTVKTGPGWVEFTQQLDCGSGYGYTYSKRIHLLKNAPLMTIEHYLLNTGSKPIETQVYDHNFLTIDHQPTGPAVAISFPFTPIAAGELGPLAEIRGNQLSFRKDLRGSDTFYTEIRGFDKTAADCQIRVENRATGAGVLITGDHPLANVAVWAVRTVVAPEPYINISIPAGHDFRWKYTYRFYTVSAASGAGKQ